MAAPPVLHLDPICNDCNGPASVVPLRTFDGTQGVDPVRWLRSLGTATICNRNVAHSPYQIGNWVRLVDRLLEGPAAHWADTHPVIRSIICRAHSDDPPLTKKDITYLVSQMRKRFTPLRDHFILPPLPPLRQGSDEDLETYYRRAEDRLHALGGIDRGGGKLNQLTEDQYSELYLLTEEYINGLYDPALRQRVRINGRVPDNKYSRSLLAVHVTSEAQACVLEKRALLAKQERNQSASNGKNQDGCKVQKAPYAPLKSATSPSHILGTIQAHRIRARLEAESRRLRAMCHFFYSTSSISFQGTVNMVD